MKHLFKKYKSVEQQTLENLSIRIKGRRYLITGTKKTDKGYSHQLKDLETGKHLRKNGDVIWFDDEYINNLKK